MTVKKRSLNEIRQTKDSYYKTPSFSEENNNEDYFIQYINFMKSEGRIAQASVINFKNYLENNNLIIKHR